MLIFHHTKIGGWVVCKRSFNSTGGLTPLLVFIPQSSTGGHTTHSKKCIPFTIFSNILGQIINKMYVLLPSRKVCVAQFLKPQPVVAKVLGSILGCAIFFFKFFWNFSKRDTLKSKILKMRFSLLIEGTLKIAFSFSKCAFRCL